MSHARKEVGAMCSGGINCRWSSFTRFLVLAAALLPTGELLLGQRLIPPWVLDIALIIALVGLAVAAARVLYPGDGR